MCDIQYYAIKFKAQIVFAYLRMRTRPSIEASLTTIETDGGNKALFLSRYFVPFSESNTILR